MSWDKFQILCWKNWTLQKRHIFSGTFEVLFPIFIVVIYSIARSNVSPVFVNEIIFKSFQPNLDYSECRIFYQRLQKVGISPQKPWLEAIIKSSVGKSLNVEFFDNSNSLEIFLKSQNYTVAGIDFGDSNINSTQLPKQLNYAIRLPHDPTQNTWKTDQLYVQSFSKAARDIGEKYYPSSPPYYNFCFLTIQNDIERSFVKAVTGRDVPSIKLLRFPYPAILDDLFVVYAGSSFPLLFVICLILASKNIIKNVTTERETQLKEVLRIMGLNSSLHWLAWFTKSLTMLELSIIPMTILLCTTLMTPNPIFNYSSPLIIWIFFTIYATSVITFCFLISVSFKKSTTAGNVGSFLFFVTLVPFNQLNSKFFTLPYIVKVMYCMLVNSGMGQGVTMMLLTEGNEEGVHFSSIFSRGADHGFSIGEVMISMLSGILVQMLFTIYIEKVFPGEIGIPEPWYFPLIPMVRFMKKKMGYDTLINRDAILQERRISGSEFEEEPSSLKIGIKIVNLTKSFGAEPAVNKLNLNIFEDQITILVGHNGAGKTSTISMLTGMIPPTSGTAYLDGKDIRTEIGEARRSLGICPQHNILFDELTVREHIIFFARLKGITGAREISEEVNRYVNLLELNEKLNAQSGTLSGGQKRKLSIGIALCGNSKIVICDEPSSGLDPSSRRSLWDLLISEKKGRTILLTTHHMDEADVLGDRIAIMAEGRLRTVGSSFFLKKKFGTGYRLICVKEPRCDVNSILDLIKEFTPDARLDSETQTEAIFIINEVYLPIFHNIFKRIEDEATRLRVSSFGCNLSTLEEVFLKLGTESTDTSEDDADNRNTALSPNDGSSTVLFDESLSLHKVTGSQLMMYQVEAMILKKFHYLRRNSRSILSMTVFSSIMIILLMSAPKIPFFSAPDQEISFSAYDKTVTVIEYDEISKNLANTYQSLILNDKDEVLLITQDIQQFLLKKSKESLSTINTKYLVAATLKNEGIMALFNGQPLHTMPLTLNTINRAILKNLSDGQSDICLTNKPYVMSEGSNDGSRFNEDLSNIFVPFFLLFILLIYWPSIFISFYIKEHSSRAKLLQLISGANRFIYWISSLIFDYTIFFVVICALVIAVGFFQRPHFSTAGELYGTYLLIFSFYGFSMLPLVYAFSYLFNKHATGESMVAVVGILLAILYGVFAIMKYLLEKEIYKFLAKILYWILMLFAPFNLIDCFKIIGISFLTPDPNIFAFNENGIGWNFIMFLCGGIIFLSICLLKDHLFFDWLIYLCMTFRRISPQNTDIDIDSDVKEEKERIKNMSSQEIVNGKLVLKGVSKFYGDHLAVNQLFLAVGSSECFGLLGINGAGKSSTFKMMTGDEIISFGDAFIRGYSMKNQLQKVHKLIGYCPQHEALLLDLTGRETLQIFSLLRGIPKVSIKETINKLSLELGFHQHLDKKIKAYSGGNKRKISTALALIGTPTLIFLDEPTTGMDASAKRKLWNIINKTRNSGSSVVMTSHSMEECEALCSRLAIMVAGEFKCLGSVQHLKNKYSKGFILTVKTGRDDDMESINAVKERIKSLFPSAEMKEHYLDILTFHITSMDLKWSEVFSRMSFLKKEMALVDYALSQLALEQVFLLFSKSGLYQKDK